MSCWGFSSPGMLHCKEECEAAEDSKRHIKLHIRSNHTDNKHAFGIIYFQSAFKCWHCLERREKFRHGDFHFTLKGQIIQEVSSLFKIGQVAEPAWTSLVEFLALSLGQGVYSEGRRKNILLTALKIKKQTERSNSRPYWLKKLYF